MKLNPYLTLYKNKCINWARGKSPPPPRAYSFGLQIPQCVNTSKDQDVMISDLTSKLLDPGYSRTQRSAFCLPSPVIKKRMPSHL